MSNASAVPAPAYAIFEGTHRLDAVPAGDRGLAYGDGVFETMRAHAGDVPWWDAHWARLAEGAQRLRIALPDPPLAHAQARELLDGAGGVLKLQLTRGTGGRGYAPVGDSAPLWILSHHPAPAAPVAGLTLRWCETRLASQPALAGIKHCNRLEQVLARGEWEDPDIHEGLVSDAQDYVVSATAANLFAMRDGEWITPPVDRCGVAGVCRAWAITALPAREARMTRDDVEGADALFVCNAVRGILPVARLGAVSWPLHPQVAGLRRRLAAEHPAFAF